MTTVHNTTPVDGVLVPQLMSTDSVDLKVTMDAADMVAITMTRAEDFINTNISRCKKITDGLVKQQDDLSKKFDAATDADATAFSADAAIAFVRTAREIGWRRVSVAVERTGMLHKQDGTPAWIHGKLTVTSKEDATNFSVAFQLKPAADTLAMFEQLVAKRKEVDTAKNEHMDWRRKLSNLPSMEKRVRARITENRLGRSLEGKALLAELTADIEQNVLRLTCN